MKRWLCAALLPAAIQSLSALEVVALEEKTTGQSEVKFESPAPVPPPRTSLTVTRPATKPGHMRAGAPQGLLGETRAVSLQEAEARLVVKGRDTLLRVGDRLGSDVVRSIAPGRMLLERPAGIDPSLGAALVVMEFDSQGRPSVYVYSTKDPNAPPPLVQRPVK